MLTIQSLSGRHNRKEFDCGKPALDEWLARTARQHQEKDISQTFVAVEVDSPSRILGFYALSACEVVTEELPRDVASTLPLKAPAMRLGRLAVDRAVQGQGLGELLLMDAIKRTCEVKEHIGAIALFVDALDDDAVSFYRKYGFVPLPHSARTLVLSLRHVCPERKAG